jgi:hypothetical protein
MEALRKQLEAHQVGGGSHGGSGAFLLPRDSQHVVGTTCNGAFKNIRFMMDASSSKLEEVVMVPSEVF